MADTCRSSPMVSCFPPLGEETGNDWKRKRKPKETRMMSPISLVGFQETGSETNLPKHGNKQSRDLSFHSSIKLTPLGTEETYPKRLPLGTEETRTMRKFILCRERLERIQTVLTRLGGSASLRNLWRGHTIHGTEVEQAAEAGFLTIETMKPATGRPSRVARIVSKTHSAKLPPHRCNIDTLISHKHWRFALNYCAGELGPGLFSFKRRAWFAYMQTYRSAKSKGAARASASRLMKRPDVRAAIQWTFASINRERNSRDHSPTTEAEVWDALRAIRSDRARWAPWYIRLNWENEEQQ